MSQNTGSSIVGLIVLVIVSVVVNYIGYTTGVQSVRKEAIMNGVAEYVSDENGEALFSWKKK